MEARKEELWGKEVKKRLIDLDLTVKSLAALIGVNYPTVSSTLSGKMIRIDVAEKINTKLLELEANQGVAYAGR